MEVDASAMFWLQLADFPYRFWPVLVGLVSLVVIGIVLLSMGRGSGEKKGKQSSGELSD